VKGAEIFVDWVSITQHHPEGGLPILIRGLTAYFDASGNCRFERTSAAHLGGSFGTSLLLRCDGATVSLSGNVGRFGRSNNLFNLGWTGTINKANRILHRNGLPPFTASSGLPGSTSFRPGGRLSRVDITGNFLTGNAGQAAQVISWIASQSVSRMKRGRAGNESVWFANTRHMFKAYRKDLEMLAHGADKSSKLVQWCADNGLVRVEVELKRRLLEELGLRDIGNVTDEKLLSVYKDQTEILRRVDRSNDVDILEALPQRTRAIASLWMLGQDVKSICSRATLFRHAKILREYGIDIMETRNICNFPAKVRVIDLQPVAAPDWYSFNEEDAA